MFVVDLNKRYNTVSGQVVGPFVLNEDKNTAAFYPIVCIHTDIKYTNNGKFFYDETPHRLNIVSEYKEETENKVSGIVLNPMETAPKDRWIMICTDITSDRITAFNLVISHWCVFDEKFLNGEREELSDQYGWIEVVNVSN